MADFDDSYSRNKFSAAPTIHLSRHTARITYVPNRFMCFARSWRPTFHDFAHLLHSTIIFTGIERRKKNRFSCLLRSQLLEIDPQAAAFDSEGVLVLLQQRANPFLAPGGAGDAPRPVSRRPRSLSLDPCCGLKNCYLTDFDDP